MSKRLKLIKFGAPWCGACKDMDRKQTLQKLAAKFSDVDVRRVDLPVDEDDTENFSDIDTEAMKLAEEYEIKSLPVLVIEDMEGNELVREEGAVPFREIEKMLEKARRKLAAKEEAA
jgi:thiol-disulfide isomerase/thioredoxin